MRLVFTVEDRRRVRAGLLAKARNDRRVVAGAEVGSTAVGGGDRWSDLDLTLGVADGIDIGDVLEDWTIWFAEKFGAVHLFDLPFQSSVYRVFLLPLDQRRSRSGAGAGLPAAQSSIGQWQ